MRAMAVMMAIGFCSAAAGAAVPKFKAQEIDKSLKIGYGVILSDINGDSKADIVVADKDRVICEARRGSCGRSSGGEPAGSRVLNV
jgi:hypothetical protein